MPEQITFTHLCARVRCQILEMGMQPVGSTDAEVTYNFTLWLLAQKRKLERDLEETKKYGEYKAQESERLQSLLDSRKGKTKQRLAILEDQVGQLMQWIDRE